LTTTRAAEVSKPKILEDRDVILKVTGSTLCGSDLHLLHGKSMHSPNELVRLGSTGGLHATGAVIQMAKGDILGHEFCGVVDSVGPAVKNIKVGRRYVASFQIACGDVRCP
jgi:threonine dehydrogenase-like Zn-dependent dehydrogenase